MTQFISFSSGSSGNCYFIGNERISFLIDCGVSLRTLKKRMAENNLELSNLSMILVSHDHIDHIKHLGNISQKLFLPVFATSKVHKALETHPATRDYRMASRRAIKKEVFSNHLGVRFVSFEVPHDATETVGFFIDFFGTKFVFMTDLGELTESALEYAQSADYLILESNFDVDMLMKGPYSAQTKTRILEGHGHLSNDQCASALKKIYNKNLKAIYLCHLSDNNNTPDKAYKSAYDALTSIGAKIGEDVKLYCLPRKDSSPLFISE